VHLERFRRIGKVPTGLARREGEETEFAEKERRKIERKKRGKKQRRSQAFCGSKTKEEGPSYRESHNGAKKKTHEIKRSVRRENMRNIEELEQRIISQQQSEGRIRKALCIQRREGLRKAVKSLRTRARGSSGRGKNRW